MNISSTRSPILCPPDTLSVGALKSEKLRTVKLIFGLNSSVKIRGKGHFSSRIDHEGPEGDYKYICTNLM